MRMSSGVITNFDMLLVFIIMIDCIAFILETISVPMKVILWGILDIKVIA